MRLFASVVLALSLLTPGLSAQVAAPPPPTRDSVTVVAGEEYEAGGLFKTFMGRGYRDLWTTPIRVPVADLAQWGGGGLTPNDVGGGATTQTLHLRGADGVRYVMRSVHKIIRDLENELVGTPVQSVLQDQLSSFHPSGAMITARLLEAVGVLHPQPILVRIPDSPLLGKVYTSARVIFELIEQIRGLDDASRAGEAGSSIGTIIRPLFEERQHIGELLSVYPEQRAIGNSDEYRLGVEYTDGLE